MTTVVPPPPPPPPISTPQVSLPTAIVSSPPAALARLPIGSLIEGNIIGKQTGGMFQIATPQGSFVMRANALLPKNAILVLQLTSLGRRPQLQIISINGKPSQPFLRAGYNFAPAKSVATPSAAPPSAGGKVANTFVALRTGVTLTATLLKPPTVLAKSSLTGAGGAKLKVNAASPPVVKGTVKALIGGRTTQSANKTTVLTPSLFKTTGKSVPTTISPSTKKVVGSYPVGTTVKVKVVSLNPPPQSAKGAAISSSILRPTTENPTPGVINGTVIGKTSSGQPMLRTSVGTFTLATRTPTPIASTITLEIMSEPTLPRQHPSAATGTPREVMLRSRTWPVLEQTLQALKEINPAIAQQVTNTVIAQPNARLAANMILFLSVLGGGNVFDWLGGGTLRTLQRFKPELVEKLKGDFKLLGKIAKEPAKGDWRVSLIPIYAGDGIEQIRVMTRGKDDEDNEENKEAEGTRFIVDVNLSRMGRLQLDGLVHNKGKHLDLIVRSDMVLSADIRNDIRGIFRDTGDLANINGGVTFQAGAADFVELSPRQSKRIGLMV